MWKGNQEAIVLEDNKCRCESLVPSVQTEAQGCLVALVVVSAGERLIGHASAGQHWGTS